MNTYPSQLKIILSILLILLSMLFLMTKPVYARDIEYKGSMQDKIVKFCAKQNEMNDSECILKRYGGAASSYQIKNDCNGMVVDEPERCLNNKLSALTVNSDLLGDNKNNSGNTNSNNGGNRNDDNTTDVSTTTYPNTTCFTGLGGSLQEKLCPKSGIFPNQEPPKTDKCYASTTRNPAGLEEYEESSCDKSTFSVAPFGEEKEEKPKQTGNECTNRTKLSAGWIVCSAVELLSDGMDAMVGYIDDMLDVDVAKMDKDGEMEKSWSYFRAIASFLLLGVGLAMIISQAIGGGN